MPVYFLAYGNEARILDVPASISAKTILPQTALAAMDPIQLIRHAIDHPIAFSWNRPLIKTVAIAVNDKTRPVPNHLLLPPLLERLAGLGIKDEQITFWIATGSHTPMQPEEFTRVLPPEIINRYKVLSHNVDAAENLEYLGETTRETPVWVNKAFYDSDLKIVVGDIEPHHFAGFSGGYKSGAIGLAGRPTINHNHAMLTHPEAWIGIFDTNPLRQDIDEIGAMMNIHLALNAVLNQEKQITSVFFGAPHQVSLAGNPIALASCGTVCEEQFDLVIASAGGQPKDINFYQAQKALTHASMFCKPGGTLILVAACPEGTGNRPYEEFMQDVNTSQEVFEKFRASEFRVGPHKAYQVARLLNNYRIYLVSDIPADLVRKLLMLPAASPQAAFDVYIKTQSQPFTIAILPNATTTIKIGVMNHG
jgi:nickel-dependent lactate racemase